MKQYGRRLGAVILTVFTLACAPTSGARPDDMSADDHRAHAAEEEKIAGEHRKQHDPDAEAEQTANIGEFWEVLVYNPTAAHKTEADTHAEHAKAHREAAAELEKFEEAECKSFPPETRKVCPLLGTIESSEEIDGGVGVRLSDKLKREAALAHMKCHLAFARTEGRKGMDNCPLYLVGVTVKAGAGPQALELHIEDDAQLPELRKRTRDHVAP